MTRQFPGFPAVLTAASLTLLCACASEPTCDYADEPYMAATSVPSLRAPEGLSAPDRSASLIVPPTPADEKPPGKGMCLDRPPSYFAIQPRTQSEPAAKEPTIK